MSRVTSTAEPRGVERRPVSVPHRPRTRSDFRLRSLLPVDAEAVRVGEMAVARPLPVQSTYSSKHKPTSQTIRKGGLPSRLAGTSRA